MTSLFQTVTKMKELEYALLTTEGTGLAHLPIHLVHVAATDNDQNVWFIIPRPTQETKAFGEHLSARLDFYKKGKPFYLCAQGEATIVTDMNEVPDLEEFQSLRTMLWKGDAGAVKVKITESEIFGEPAEEKVELSKGFGSTLTSWYQWLFAPVAQADGEIRMSAGRKTLPLQR